MKKTLLIAVLLTIGTAMTSQAVVIHWAATTPSDVYAYDSVKLVYVSDGNAPSYTQIMGGLPVVGTASGHQLVGYSTATPDGVRERTATGYGSASGAGAYYVVLFNGLQAVAVSQSSLAWDSMGGAITSDSMNPGTGVFNPGSWTPVPEPGTLALVGLGAAALVIRRRRMRK